MSLLKKAKKAYKKAKPVAIQAGKAAAKGWAAYKKSYEKRHPEGVSGWAQDTREHETKKRKPPWVD